MFQYFCNGFHCSDKDVATYMDTRSQSGRTPRQTPIQLPCACANLRKASLVATQFYDAVLRPSGVRVTQFTLLQALNRAPGISQKNLAELLGVDSTTLTRTLAGLRRKGWLRSETGTDRRELRLFLMAAGQEEYKRALPYWRSAQRRLRQALGEGNWNQVMKAAVRTAEVMPKL
jgi:DNA-binding MarR family transcriptional regulator